MYKKLFGSLIYLLFILGILSFFSNLIITYYGTPFDKVIGLLKPDIELGWIQKSRLDTNFIGSSVKTNDKGFRANSLKFDNTYNILILGPSSAFGWGVELEETYPHLLEGKLNSLGGNKYKVYNASVIGFSSKQGEILWNKYFKDSTFDAVILAYGINDIDRHRFFFRSNDSDTALFAKRIQRISYLKEEFIYSSSFFRAINIFLRWGILNYGCPKIELPLSKRLSRAETLNAFKNIITSARKNNIKTYILNTPYNFETNGRLEKQLVKLDHSKYNAKKFKEAKNYYEDLVKEHQTSDVPYYYLSQIALQEGNCFDSRNYFRKALSAEKYRLVENIDTINESLHDLAKEEKIMYIDANKSISMTEDYFLDTVHPSIKGHQVLADLIYQKIQKADQ